MWYVRDVLYAVLYVRVSCFVVRVRYVGDVLYAVCYVCICSVYGVVVWCCVSWCYVYVGYGDVLEVLCVYFEKLYFCVVCVDVLWRRMCVNVVSDLM